jgi:hypothetical protein
MRIIEPLAQASNLRGGLHDLSKTYGGETVDLAKARKKEVMEE